MHQPDYIVVSVTEDTVYIIDTDDGNISVTNSAETVVKKIYEQFGDKRLVYRDTMGRWDEILHDRGIFVGFTAWEK